jgi:hypothetical protein
VRPSRSAILRGTSRSATIPTVPRAAGRPAGLSRTSGPRREAHDDDTALVSSTRWNDLDPRIQRTIVFAAGVEIGLKIAALIDLAPRPRHEIRGEKVAWAAAITLINAAGVVPVVYFLHGRVGRTRPS